MVQDEIYEFRVPSPGFRVGVVESRPLCKVLGEFDLHVDIGRVYLGQIRLEPALKGEEDVPFQRVVAALLCFEAQPFDEGTGGLDFDDTQFSLVQWTHSGVRLRRC